MRTFQTILSIFLLQTLTASTGEVRLEPPAEDAQKAASTLIRDVFSADYAKPGLQDKKSLAAKLFQQATDTHDDLPAQYVLLRETEELAAQAGDAPLLLRALSLRTERFLFNPVLEAERLLEIASRSPGAKDHFAAICNGYLQAIDTAITSDDFDTAVRLATKSEAAARSARDLTLVSRAQARVKETKELLAEFQKVRASIEKLKTAPDDPESNFAVGRFQCLVKDNWVEGLLLLSKGSDIQFKAAAEKDIALGSEPANTALIECADGWWSLSEKLQGSSRATLQAHSAELYRRALPMVSGLAKARLEKRIAESTQRPNSQGTARRTELIQLVDPKNAIAGTWKRDGNDLVCDKTQYGRMMFPCTLGENYDVALEFTCVETKGCATLILQRGGKALAFEFGSYGRSAGFTLIDGRGLDANPTATPVPGGYQLGTRYSILVQVRKDRLTAFVDGKPLVETSIPNDRIKLDPRWDLPTKNNLGIGGYGGVLRIHSLQVSGDAVISK